MRQINPVNNNGSIQLKFAVEGRRYSFSPFQKSRYGDRQDMQKAASIADRISREIAGGYFDPTLDRYRKKSKANALPPPTKLVYVLEVWDKWVATLHLSDRTLKAHYTAIRVGLDKSNPTIASLSEWLQPSEGLSPATFNARCGYLRRCFRWAVSEGLTDANPLDKVPTRRTTKTRIKPFSPDEVSNILHALRSNRFKPSASAFPHSLYANWVEFLFLTGCRPSEAIGLQVKHVNLQRHIEISSVLARGDRGETNGAARVRKPTKTDNVRYLPLNPRLWALLEPRCTGKPSEALVFASPTGQAIDDRMFGRRVWKRVLEGLEVEYRRLYVTRHTFASIALEQGSSIATVAYLLGHLDLKMVIETYGHLVSKPVMPDILDQRSHFPIDP